MCSGDTTWADIEDLMKRFLDGGGEPIFGGEKSMFNGSYGLSKAALTVFTMQMAAKHPNIKVGKIIQFDHCVYKFPSCSPRVCHRATFRPT